MQPIGIDGEMMRYALDHRYIPLELPIENMRPKVVAPPPTYKPRERTVTFILVKLAPSYKEDRIRDLRGIDGISGIHPVYGEYDLVLIVRERNDIDKHLLMRKIRAITGVVDVQTLLAAS